MSISGAPSLVRQADASLCFRFGHIRMHMHTRTHIPWISMSRRWQNLYITIMCPKSHLRGFPCKYMGQDRLLGYIRSNISIYIVVGFNFSSLYVGCLIDWLDWQICLGMAYNHQQGIVSWNSTAAQQHRRLHPSTSPVQQLLLRCDPGRSKQQVMIDGGWFTVSNSAYYLDVPCPLGNW